MKQQTEISDLIFKQLIEDSTKEELELLNQWREQDIKNENLYKRIISEQRIKRSFQVYNTLELDKAFNKVIAPKSKQRRLIPLVLKYVAVISIPLLFAVGVWLLSDKSQESLRISENISPGTQKATVTLSDGQVVQLDKGSPNVVLKDKGLVVGKDSSSVLSYSSVEVNSVVYNTIQVPYGGEYQVVLSDGTKVCLNAGSVLKFPVRFVGSTREVSLIGEGYFEVAHNATKPFKVHTNHSMVKVYGTTFNVMSYVDDKVEQITLVEGRVGMNVNGQQTMLKPGQQAELSYNSSQVKVKEVDTNLYTSWIGGVFRFKNMPMKELAKKLSRWYNVDFFFANDAVSEFPYSGRINRDTDFEYFMSLIEKTTNVEVTIEGRTVLVKEIK